jgi:rare lipoprotein A
MAELSISPWLRPLALLAGAAAILAGCSTEPPPAARSDTLQPSGPSALARAIEPGYKIGNPYRIAGQWYKPEERFDLVQHGIASWYGPGFHGRLTANGEQYDMHAFTAAHRTLQLPSIVRVENLENGKTVIVRVNDRGPYVDGRIIDLSRKAAAALDLQHKGLARVKVAVLPDHSRRVAAMAKNKANVGAMDDIVLDLNANPPADYVPQPPVRVADNRPVGDVFLQAAVFSVEQYATRARTLLRGVGPVVITPMQRGDRTLYRVQVGPYGDRSEADAALRRVREVGFEGAHVVAQG